MTCADCTRLLTALVDDELELRAALEVEEHLRGCASCAALLQRERAARTALSRATRHELPDALARRLAAALRETPEALRFSRARRRRALALALPAAAALLVVVALPLVRRPSAEADELVAAHLRSLLPDHLTDVASSDRHTVKPWFQGKLDFAVPARDLAEAGFALVGGRLDVVAAAGERPVAALVYQRRKHLVNVFIWPDASASRPESRTRLRGFALVSWTRDHLHFAAVSDLDEADLSTLARLLQAPAESDSR